MTVKLLKHWLFDELGFLALHRCRQGAAAAQVESEEELRPQIKSFLT